MNDTSGAHGSRLVPLLFGHQILLLLDRMWQRQAYDGLAHLHRKCRLEQRILQLGIYHFLQKFEYANFCKAYFQEL